MELALELRRYAFVLFQVVLVENLFFGQRNVF